MQAAQQEQMMTIISNLEATNKKIPYFSELEQHPVFGAVFKDLDQREKQQVEKIIENYLLQKVEEIKKTKGGQLFARFVENDLPTFWEFRTLNAPENNDQQRFQELGKIVEDELFKLEGILTERMFKQEKGLDKVIDAFYTIIYLFFPRFSEIE